ncbi:MAG TPA: ubiquitin-like small modifier protein 1 [Dehalococcoidia bacterium]|nr:ubiquitin-like small modifier protein 1 [Dehalococcoidia bacterium]
MSVEVRVTSVLQRVVGAKSVQSDGKTVAEVLEGINSQYPGFREQITQEDGSLHRFVNIYINDEDIRYLQSLDTPVNEGDVLSILPALAGGSSAHDSRRDAALAPSNGGAGVSPDLQSW